MRILIAEDEKKLNQLIAGRLTDEGYSVDRCENGKEALDYLSCAEYDAVILDIMMPEVDGLTVLKTIRAQKSNVPVLLLTARDSISDRVTGLDCGANDYLVKPFSFEELCARVRSMLRVRFGQSTNELTADTLVLDPVNKKVRRGDRPLVLSAKEYALLEYLLRNKGVILSKERIENHIWNFDYEGGTNVVAVYINYLREKVDKGEAVRLIHTVRGVGYVLREEQTP